MINLYDKLIKIILIDKRHHKYLFGLVLFTSGLSYSHISFAESASKVNKLTTAVQASVSQYEQDKRHWQLLVLVGVIGLMGSIKNRKPIRHKLNSRDNPMSDK